MNSRRHLHLLLVHLRQLRLHLAHPPRDGLFLLIVSLCARFTENELNSGLNGRQKLASNRTDQSVELLLMLGLELLFVLAVRLELHSGGA